MPPDPRWLEILKASGWQTTGLAFAFGIFWLVFRSSTAIPAWAIPADVFCFLICGGLSLTSFGHALADFLQPRKRLAEWFFIRQQRQAVREYIPFMTEQEKGIFAYLLAHNQKTFTGEYDGGNAVTLISRGFIRCAARPDQSLPKSEIPFFVPDHVWEEIAKQRESFPYVPKLERGVETHPWRIHWMLL